MAAQEAKRLDALNLVSPAALRDATAADLAASKLTGYEAMRKIRDDAAQFRRDYANWRKGGASGSRGEGLAKNPSAPLSASRERSDSNQYLAFAHNPLSELPAPSVLPLRRANLRALASSLDVPVGDVPPINKLVAHVGVGGFHRSHQAYATDALLRVAGGGGGDAWGILGVGLMPFDRAMRDALVKQDMLYTLLARGNDGSKARVVQSIVDYAFLPDDPEGSLVKLEDARVRILSLTVTEKGYYRTADGDLDVDAPPVAADLASWKPRFGCPAPATALGLACTVLARRRHKGIAPMTILSCDNLPMNGATARAATLAFAEKVDADLAKWIADTVSFPSSMVDRITPKTEPAHVALLRDEYGVEDAWPVVCEPFLQWVVEDDFPTGRPRWEDAAQGPLESITFVENVEPYELMKLRLLNSSHSAMAYAGLLLGATHVDEAMADIDVVAFLRGYMGEVAGSLSPIAGVNFLEYRATLTERFKNAYIKDTLDRLAEDGSAKFAATLASALEEYFAPLAPAAYDVVALALAAFMRACGGKGGGAGAEESAALASAIEIRDPRAAALAAAANAALAAAGGDALAAPTEQFLSEIFGKRLVVDEFPGFAVSVAGHFRRIVADGARACLAAYRVEQLAKVRCEIASTYGVLRELQRQEILLTPPSEDDETTVNLTS